MGRQVILEIRLGVPQRHAVTLEERVHLEPRLHLKQTPHLPFRQRAGAIRPDSQRPGRVPPRAPPPLEAGAALALPATRRCDTPRQPAPRAPAAADRASNPRGLPRCRRADRVSLAWPPHST